MLNEHSLWPTSLPFIPFPLPNLSHLRGPNNGVRVDTELRLQMVQLVLWSCQRQPSWINACRAHCTYRASAGGAAVGTAIVAVLLSPSVYRRYSRLVNRSRSFIAGSCRKVFSEASWPALGLSQLPVNLYLGRFFRGQSGRGVRLTARLASPIHRLGRQTSFCTSYKKLLPCLL